MVTIRWTAVGSGGALDQLPTQGALTRLSPDTVAAVLADVGEELGDTVTVSYTTVVVTALKE